MNKTLKIGLFLGVVVLVFALPTFAFASDVFSQSEKLLNDAQTFFLKVSTAAAVVGVGTGVGFKKFSMGNEHKIATGNKVLSGSIIGWAVLNGLPLILGTIQKYI